MISSAVVSRKSSYCTDWHLAQTGGIKSCNQPILGPRRFPCISTTVPISVQMNTTKPHFGQVAKTNSPCPSQQAHLSPTSSQVGGLKSITVLLVWLGHPQ